MCWTDLCLDYTFGKPLNRAWNAAIIGAPQLPFGASLQLEMTLRLRPQQRR